MKIGLFIPCYVDQFYPQVGVATLQLLEKLGHEVEFPENQTCCGQPMANSGYESITSELGGIYEAAFEKYDAIVAPSGSCVLHVHEHANVRQDIKEKTWEICQFLMEYHGPDLLEATFPYKVGLHQSCHGLRGLRLGKSSELVSKSFSVVQDLLQNVSGLELIPLNRVDECCGFGGTFAVAEEAVSISMGNDRLQDHLQNQAEVIAATDMSCLMHLEGLAKRQKLPLKFMHVVEILNSSLSNS